MGRAGVYLSSHQVYQTMGRAGVYLSPHQSGLSPWVELECVCHLISWVIKPWVELKCVYHLISQVIKPWAELEYVCHLISQVYQIMGWAGVCLSSHQSGVSNHG